DRFALPPEKYLDYVALKGDTSDNIPGVPGVGEKTASKLVQDFGSIEQLLARTDELKGRIRTAIETAGSDLVRNKELARLVCDLDLPVDPADCVMGEWDQDAVRRLFNSLEFRTLLERLEEVERTAKPAVERATLDIRPGTPAGLPGLLDRTAPRAVAPLFEGEVLRGVAVSPGGGQAVFVPFDAVPESLSRWLADAAAPKWVHNGKDFEAALRSADCTLAGVTFDTMLAGYLLDPAEA